MFILKSKTILISIIFLFSTIGFLIALDRYQFLNEKVFSLINSFNPVKTYSEKLNYKILDSTTWQDPRNLFPIFAYNIPSNTNNLASSLKIIEKGGINILINGNYGWMPDPLKLREAFIQSKVSKLKWIAIIENECKDDFIFSNTNDETNKDIIEYLKLFNDEFIYGWYIWDEPGKNRKLCSPFNLIPNDDFEDINRMVKQIRRDAVFRAKLDFINLFPTYWSETKNLSEYENYLNNFYYSQEFKPKVFCFDHYPFLFQENGGFRKDYFANLEIIRKKSLQWGIPFWMIILSSGHDNYKNPTFEEIRFQVYSALAYGAKGIGYYLYSRSFEQIGYRSWILEDFVDNENVADSLHGPLFVPVQNLNKQIQSIGKILSNSNSIGVLHLSDYPNGQVNINSILDEKLKNLFYLDTIDSGIDSKPDTDLLIGFFNDINNKFNKRLLIVNKNFNKQIKTKIDFQRKLSIKKLNKVTDKLEEYNNVQSLEIEIAPGDGELYILDEN